MGKLFRQIHIELSLFFLPLALLYATTGALYLSGFNQDSGAKIWKLTLPQMQKEDLPKAVNDELLKNGLRQIENATLRKGKRNTLLMGGADYSVTLSEDKSNGGWNMRVVKRGFWGNLIMLHKGKAKWYFDVLAYAFATSLIIFYFSGLMMTKFCQKRRGRALAVTGFGFLVAIVVGYLSIL